MRHELSIAFQTDKSARDYIALAQLVNDYAFDCVTVYCDAPYHPSFGPLLLMAPHLKRARLGPAAVSPSRIHPIDIAAETALLAQVAAGGVYVGISRGAWLDDHGIREQRPAIPAIRESIEILRYLLSGQTGGYDGQVFQLAQHVTAPYPLPAPPVPVLIGTWGPKLAALAGEIVDEVKIGGSANPAMVPIMQGYIAQGEARAGREPGSVGVVMGAVCVVDEDREQARAMARRAAVMYLPVIAGLDSTLEIDPALLDRLRDFANAQDYAGGAALISDALLDCFAFSGAPQDLIAQAEALFDAGASRIEFGTPHGLDPTTGIRLLGEQVLPAVQALWP